MNYAYFTHISHIFRKFVHKITFFVTTSMVLLISVMCIICCDIKLVVYCGSILALKSKEFNNSIYVVYLLLQIIFFFWRTSQCWFDLGMACKINLLFECF